MSGVAGAGSNGRPINDKLVVWTGHFAALSTEAPGTLGGTWCFRGTRLPVAALFELARIACGGCVKILFDANTPAPLEVLWASGELEGGVPA
jgi:hypothetical protein